MKTTHTKPGHAGFFVVWNSSRLQANSCWAQGKGVGADGNPRQGLPHIMDTPGSGKIIDDPRHPLPSWGALQARIVGIEGLLDLVLTLQHEITQCIDRRLPACR